MVRKYFVGLVDGGGYRGDEEEDLKPTKEKKVMHVSIISMIGLV
jgi:hypothetical protein